MLKINVVVKLNDKSQAKAEFTVHSKDYIWVKEAVMVRIKEIEASGESRGPVCGYVG